MLLTLALTVSALGPDTTVTIGGTEVELVHVEAGAFRREVGPGREQRVVLTRDFWIGATEVTWSTWEGVMGWTDGRAEPEHPARGISWHDAVDFLALASAETPGWTFRLPTEAEWEFAARAGSTTAWTTGDDEEALTEVAWIRANAGGAVQPVGRLSPNAWGLYDTHGNVWEWVGDWMGAYPDHPYVTDPTGPTTGLERVRRGGSAVYGPDAARSSHRYQQPPDRGNGNLGFRVVAVRVPDGPG